MMVPARIPLILLTEEQMAWALYVPQVLDQIHTSIVPAVSLDPDGASVARVSLSIDAAGIRPKKVKGSYTSLFKLLAAVFDENGMIVRDYRQDYRLSLDEAGYRDFLKRGSNISLNVKLAPGKYRIKTVLRDLDSGKMSTRQAALYVPALPSGLP